MKALPAGVGAILYSKVNYLILRITYYLNAQVEGFGIANTETLLVFWGRNYRVHSYFEYTCNYLSIYI